MSGSTQASIQTRRLQLVPLVEEHLEHAVQLDSDPEVVRFVGNGKPPARGEVAELHRERVARAAIVPGLGFWAGFLDGQFVGWWVLAPPGGPVDVTGRVVIGFRLRRQFWRQGLAKEGALALLRYGFADIGLQSVYGETMAVNSASRATMTSIGMKYVRTFYLDFDEPIPGTEEGEVEYAITREEWEASQRS